MSKKKVCQVPPFWTLEQFHRHSCDDRSHGHITLARARLFENTGRVRWLREPDPAGTGGILSLSPERIAGIQTSARIATVATVRGLSCRVVGEYLLFASIRGELWARVMIAQMCSRGVMPADD